jgi:hypothetical protein
MISKKEILEQCIRQVDEALENMQAVIEEAQRSANKYGAPRDRYDSYRAQLLRKKDMFGQQMVKSRQQLEVLKKIDLKRKSDTIGFGSLIKTQNQFLFISTGLGKVELNGNSIYAISTMVPIYKVLEGKKEGDLYEFNGKKGKIVSVE